MKRIKDRLSQTIKLRDGRKLGFAELGDPKGKPVFYFHGNPGTRIEAKLAEIAHDAISTKIISVERPGFGLSDYKKKRTILSWSADVEELADELGLDKFSILGVCAGGPYVLSCAYQMPDRCKSVGIIASTGPVNRTTVQLDGVDRRAVIVNSRFPWVFRFFIWLKLTRHVRSRDESRIRRKVLNHVTKNFSKPDKVLAKNQKIMDVLCERMRESALSGVRAILKDRRLIFKPWGFKLKDISPEVKVHLWQGELDKTVPISVGRFMATRIPNCEATFYPGEGHISVCVNKMKEISNTLIKHI